MDDDFDEWDEDHSSEQDIDGVIRTLKKAWQLVPGMTLGAMLDLAVPAALYELDSDEVKELLNEFIHQNE